MNSESTLFTAIWEVITDKVKANDRGDIAMTMLRAFQDFGFEPVDLRDAADEDPHVNAAYEVVFGDGEDEDYDYDADEE